MTRATLRQEILETIEHLHTRWQEVDRTLLRNIFPLLAQGHPVGQERILDATGASRASVAEALASRRVGKDSQGRVTELFGLMLAPTRHRVDVDGVVIFTCCAVVAHLVPALVAKTVDVESVDPATRGLVRLTITPAGVASVDPPQAAATWVVTEQAAILENAGANLCIHLSHFVSPKSAADFADGDRRRFPIEIVELNAAAQHLYTRIWT